MSTAQTMPSGIVSAYGMFFCFFIFLFFIYSLYQLRAMQCHVHGRNDTFCALFMPIVSFFAFFKILLLLLPFYYLRLTQNNTTVTYTNHHTLMFFHVKLAKCDSTMTHTNYHPLPSLYTMPMVCFIFSLILLLLTNALPHQVNETQPNDQPTPPACAMSMA